MNTDRGVGPGLKKSKLKEGKKYHIGLPKFKMWPYLCLADHGGRAV
jgi:hypothetical protein